MPAALRVPDDEALAAVHPQRLYGAAWLPVSSTCPLTQTCARCPSICSMNALLTGSPRRVRVTAAPAQNMSYNTLRMVRKIAGVELMRQHTQTSRPDTPRHTL
eukprot:1740462-Prymnesium_polylepis.1